MLLSTPVRGLYVYQNFLSSRQAVDVWQKAIGLHTVILHQVPSDRTFFSKNHNLRSEEHYRVVQITDKMHGDIRGQYFERYGENGHRLTYFMGSRNIPEFLKNNMISRTLQIPEVKALVRGGVDEWNFTFNTYAISKIKATTLPGFDFHKDIASNGEATLIYSIGTSSKLQMRHPSRPLDVFEIPLLHNSLVLLSKEARWDYEHRVVPINISNDMALFEDGVESIKRISLVFGFTSVSEGVLRT